MSDKIKSTRKCVRTDITRSINKIRNTLGSLEISDLEVGLQKFIDLKDQITTLDDGVFTELLGEDANEATLQAEYDLSAKYIDELRTVIVNIKRQIANTVTPGSAANFPVVQNSNVASNAQRIKLPEITLPTYGHKDGEDLEKFFINFENIVGHLSDFNKLIYLHDQLTGEPKCLLKMLDANNQTYNAAKDLLNRAFASTSSQKFDAIKRVTELKFLPKLPYEYMGTLHQVIDNFKIHKIVCFMRLFSLA